MTKILSNNIDSTFIASLATLTGNQALSNKTLIGVKENVNVVTSALQATNNIDFLNSSVYYYTSAATLNFTLNIRGSASSTLDSSLSIGQSININVLITNTTTPYYCNTFQIDGITQSVKVVNGTAISAGNTNSIDMYSIYIVKLGTNSFTTLVSQTKFA
jgi:hypothetical protein